MEILVAKQLPAHRQPQTAVFFGLLQRGVVQSSVDFGLFQVAAQWLFQEDVGPVLGAGHHHVAVGVEPARRHADDLRVLLLEHLPVVGVLVSPQVAISVRQREAHLHLYLGQVSQASTQRACGLVQDLPQHRRVAPLGHRRADAFE